MEVGGFGAAGGGLGVNVVIGGGTLRGSNTAAPVATEPAQVVAIGALDFGPGVFGAVVAAGAAAFGKIGFGRGNLGAGVGVFTEGLAGYVCSGGFGTAFLGGGGGPRPGTGGTFAGILHGPLATAPEALGHRLRLSRKTVAETNLPQETLSNSGHREHGQK